MNEYINEELIQNTYLYCLKRISDSEAAKDLSQDILLEALKAIKTGKNIESFYSWYWRMAHNKYVDYIAHKQRPWEPIETGGGVATALVSDLPEPLDNMIAAEEISELNYSLSRLNKLYREIIIKFYLKEQTITEIATELNVPVGTVKRRLFDAKQNIKERITMKNIGQSSYAPAEVNYFWGFCVGHAETVLKNKIAEQTMVICRSEAKTINEIADEIGVAPVYLEQVLDDMVKELLLIQPAKGKYIANTCVYPNQKYTDAEHIIYTEIINRNIPKRVCDAVYSIKDKIMSLDFYGKDLGFEYLCWEYLVVAASYLGEEARSIYVRKYTDKYADEDRRYRLTMMYLNPDEKLTTYGDNKGMPWSNLWQSFKTNQFGNVNFVNDYDNKPFPKFADDNNRNGWIDGCNISTLLELVKNPCKELNEYEEEIVANFIKNGMVKKSDAGLQVMVPVYDRNTYKELENMLHEVIKPIAAELEASCSDKVEAILKPYVRNDLMSNFIYWDMRILYQPIGEVMYYGVNESDCLAKPDDYKHSAAGLFVLTENQI